MGYKIFISYKYSDSHVRKLKNITNTTARDYVDELQSIITSADSLNKGEMDGESLKGFQDDTIQSKLKDKIYDSSITVVLISKNMKDPNLQEQDQWIPWEIAYSLRDKTRDGRTSKTNGMLAVVLPDEVGSYDYYFEDHFCPSCSTTKLRTDKIFKILRENMFNHTSDVPSICNNGHNVYYGECSYIKSIKWDDFIVNADTYFEKATELRNKLDEYEVKINVY